MIAIIKPLSASALRNFIFEADRVRCSKHRAVLILKAHGDLLEVEEIATGLTYPVYKKNIMRVDKATPAQLAELTA